MDGSRLHTLNYDKWMSLCVCVFVQTEAALYNTIIFFVVALEGPQELRKMRMYYYLVHSSFFFFLNSSRTKIAVKKYVSIYLTKSETFIFFMFVCSLFHETNIERWVNLDNKRFLLYEKNDCRKKIWTTMACVFFQRVSRA